MPEQSIDPLKEARPDALKWGRRAQHKLVDWFRKYATVALLKVVIVGGAAGAVAVVELPLFAGVAATAAIGLLIVYGFYATRLLKRKDAQLRWAWIAQHRREQDRLRAELSLDRAILALLGQDRSLSKIRPIELRQTITHLRSREATEQAAARTPLVQTRTHAVAPAPDVAKVRANVKLKEVKLAEAEAEIQSLAVPENVANKMAAEEARRSRRQVQDLALAADRAARENTRRGRTASPSIPGIGIQITASPLGTRSVTNVAPPPTPEQIAHGEGSGPIGASERRSAHGQTPPHVRRERAA